MNLFKKGITKLRKWIQALPDRKQYIDFIAGILGIPALIMVLLLNYNNLQGSKKTEDKTTQPPAPIIIEKTVTPEKESENKNNSTTAPTTQVCKKEIGPIEITYPEENETISENPVTVIIDYDNDTYCSVVWSYRINGGSWSEYTNSSISLFDMPAGKKKLELRVQSTVSQDTEKLERNFTYEKKADEKAASVSANMD